MKHKITVQEPKFHPIKIEITLESRAELDLFTEMMGKQTNWGYDLYEDLKHTQKEVNSVRNG